jgi:hypothetical protein
MKTIHQLAAVIARATVSTKPNPPCAANPDDWDLDIGTPDAWWEAVRTCHGCLLLAQCRERVVTLTGRGTPTGSRIWTVAVAARLRASRRRGSCVSGR